MADNDFVDELTVEHRKRTVVGNAFERIRLLFDVLVNFSTPEESAVKSGIQWLALKGEKDNLNKAKVCKLLLGKTYKPAHSSATLESLKSTRRTKLLEKLLT